MSQETELRKRVLDLKDRLNTRGFGLASPDDLLFLAGSMMEICDSVLSLIPSEKRTP